MVIAEMTIGPGVAIIVSTVTAIGIFISGLIVTTSRKNREKIETLALEVALLKQQIKPFWESMQARIADVLHHPGEEHKELDGLLEKLKAMELTAEERLILEGLLKILRRNAPTDTAQKAAHLLEVMPMAVAEAKGEIPPSDQRTMEQKKEAERVNGAPA